MSVTYTAVLDVSEDSVLFLSGLLHAERIRRGTRTGTRALSTYKQAVRVLRWLLDDLAAWVDDGQLGLADLGYEGEAELLRLPIKKPTHGHLTVDEQAYNAV